jgi:hypothetical protein
MALEEPTVAELVRQAMAKIDHVGSQVLQVQALLSNYVTQEQRTADRELADHKHRDLSKDVEEIKTKSDTSKRLALSAFVAPVIVGLVMWLLTTTGAKA